MSRPRTNRRTSARGTGIALGRGILLVATVIIGAVLVAPASSAAATKATPKLFLSCATGSHRSLDGGAGCSWIRDVELVQPASWEELSKPGLRSVEIRLPSTALERCPVLATAVRTGQSLSGIELGDATPGSRRVARSGVVQFAFADGSVRPVSKGIHAAMGDGSVRSHSGGANFAMADGSVHFVRLTLRFAELRAGGR